MGFFVKSLLLVTTVFCYYLKMNLRQYKESDKEKVEKIFSVYWTDPEFLKELSNELRNNNNFIVIEKNEEILGIAGFRKIPNYLKTYIKTGNPKELYIIAVKNKRKGIGGKLIEELKNYNISELILYSPNSHKESWNFYIKNGFKKIEEITPPDDEVGQVFRKIL